MAGRQEVDEWKRSVLKAMRPAAWLQEPGHDRDVFVSTRWRAARSVAGFPFPHRSSPQQLVEVQRMAEAAGSFLAAKRRLSRAERDYLLGARLISPDFAWLEQNRTVLLDERREVSVMVNEEDHIRIQCIRPGLDIEGAVQAGEAVERRLAEGLDFVHHPRRGWLTASPANAGEGRRFSVLVHLIGLAHRGELRGVLAALGSEGLTARGLYGESSNAVGAFYQISLTGSGDPRLSGACQYLLHKEREARELADMTEARRRAEAGVRAVIGSPEISLADALRVLAWQRWMASEARGGPGAMEADSWTAVMEVSGALDAEEAARRRAGFLRDKLESAIRATAADQA